MQRALRVLRTLLAAATAAVCLLLVWQVVDIYRVGNLPENFSAPGVRIQPVWSREIVGERLSAVAPALLGYLALAAAGLVSEAVSAPEMEDGPAMEISTYEAGGYTVDGIIQEELLAAVAAEYAPYGITCEDGRWYFEGQPIRVFTDVLTSNGESLTGGRFQGTIRNFAGEGDIDVRTVRDYDHCDRDGNGKLLYIETCPARGDAVWTEHHAEEENH